MTRHLGVDLGAESGRLVCGTLCDGKLELEELCRFPTQGLHIFGGIRWNVYRFYEEIVSGIRKYVERYGNELSSIGVDTWGVDYALLDERGELLELPYCYRDSRTSNTFEQIDPYKKKIYEKSGVQFLIFNTINQLIAESKVHNSILPRAKKLLFIGDFLHYMLGAEPCNEYTVASISQLVNTQLKCWDNELFELMKLPSELQGKLVYAGDKIGTISQTLINETGLATPVSIITPALHDTASAIVSVPAEGENWGYISSGTWSLAGVELDYVVTTQDALKNNISNSGGAFNKNLFLKNIMGLWLIQQCKKFWNASLPDLSYDDIMKKADAAPAFLGFIDPDDDVFFSPENMPKVICDYLSRTSQTSVLPDDIGSISRIIYESLSLKYRYVFELICSVSNKKIDTLHIIGGGSKNATLNQMTANAMRIPVKAGPSEATVMGNILVQAYGCGFVESLSEIRGIVRASSTVQTFMPCDNAIWDKAFQKFVRVCKLD